MADVPPQHPKPLNGHRTPHGDRGWEGSVGQWLVGAFRTLIAASVLAAAGFAIQSNTALQGVQVTVLNLASDIKDFKQDLVELRGKVDDRYTADDAQRDRAEIRSELKEIRDRLRLVENRGGQNSPSP